MEYPSYAMVQITSLVVPVTQFKQPGPHGTMLPLILVQLTPPPIDWQLPSICELKPLRHWLQEMEEHRAQLVTQETQDWLNDR
jgi:hypothetical protein